MVPSGRVSRAVSHQDRSLEEGTASPFALLVGYGRQSARLVLFSQ